MLDLFDYPEMQSKIVQDVLETYGNPIGYDECDLLVQQLNQVGYTCDYGLDACPYNLRRIKVKLTNYEDIAHLAWALNNQI